MIKRYLPEWNRSTGGIKRRGAYTHFVTKVFSEIYSIEDVQRCT